MKRMWMRFLVVLAIVTFAIVFAQRRTKAVAQNPQCQPCKDQAFQTLKQCRINACTSAGGVPDLQSGNCDKPQNPNTYSTLLAQCAKAYNAAIANCPCP